MELTESDISDARPYLQYKHGLGALGFLSTHSQRLAFLKAPTQAFIQKGKGGILKRSTFWGTFLGALVWGLKGLANGYYTQSWKEHFTGTGSLKRLGLFAGLGAASGFVGSLGIMALNEKTLSFEKGEVINFNEQCKKMNTVHGWIAKAFPRPKN